jgi:glutamate-1-semialdehyde 2,1-aminomutase
MMNKSKSEALFAKSKTYFPGGVNSPVRAFKSVGGTPHFMHKGDGAMITDVDGNTFIDFCCSWGPLLHGHNHPNIREAIIDAVGMGTSFGAPTLAENTLAELIINNHKHIEKLRFVSSGTEAVMSAIRLARGITSRNKIIKFEGCYHGHYDGLLVKAGSGLATFGVATSAGIPESWAAETLVCPLNDTNAFDALIAAHQHEIAAVIIEPIPANNGLLLQTKTYLEHLRKCCDAHCILLIFDEVISGFRVGFEGAAGLYGIAPDLITFGKIIGGGMPVGAYGGSAKLMSRVAPEGDVYQAGTLSGNPVAMSAGAAALQLCLQPEFYTTLANNTLAFTQKINHYTSAKNYPFHVVNEGSIFWMIFDGKEVLRNADNIASSGISKFNQLYPILLNNGVYFGPSGYEVGFVSAAHTPAILDRAADIICQGLDVVFG